MGKKGKAQGRAGQKQKAQKASRFSSSPGGQQLGRGKFQTWEDSGILRNPDLELPSSLQD